jgi:glycosyltransferase involved in cell wall biosynthesis
MNSKISIIVPVYNCESYLQMCIESILNQTYKNFEALFIDDGSTDRSGEIIKKYTKYDSRVRYYSQENSGPSEARNNGILHSVGDYIVFIDSDDTVEKNYLEILLEKLQETEADLTCCGYKDLSSFGEMECMDFGINSSISKHSFMEMVSMGTGGVLWGKIYKREIIINNKLKMDKDLFMSEDLVFVLQYASHCKKFSSVGECLYIYNRLNLNSITHRFSLDYVTNYITVFQYIETILLASGMDLQRVNTIVRLRIQSFVLAIIENQVSNIKRIGYSQANKNVKNLLSIKEIQNHKPNFISKEVLYKPFISLIKSNSIRILLFYGLILNLLKNYKHKFTLQNR